MKIKNRLALIVLASALAIGTSNCANKTDYTSTSYSELAKSAEEDWFSETSWGKKYNRAIYQLGQIILKQQQLLLKE